MSFLEKKIQENKKFFDNQPLPEGHRDRFAARLDTIDKAQVKSERLPNIIRIAAVVFVMISGYFVLRNISFDNLGGAVLDGVTEISFSPEIENVFAYYDALSQQKFERIEELAPNKTEAEKIKEIAGKKLQDLDANLAEIEKEYAKYPENERLKAALVNNKRKKAEIMDDILKQLNEANKSTMEEAQPAGKVSANP